MSDNTNSSSGVSLYGLLTVVFVTLKLCGVIAWSWWWVMSPLWIPAVLWVAVFLFVFSTVAFTVPQVDITLETEVS